MSRLFGLELDGDNRYAEVEEDGCRRVFVYLDHPSSGGKKKRFATALTPEQFDRLRDEIAETDPSARLAAALTAASSETWKHVRELLRRVERHAPRFTNDDLGRDARSHLPAPEIDELVDYLDRTGLVVPFDWLEWLKIVGPLDADPIPRLEACTAEECLGYLTAILRSARFVEGSFERQFLDGYPQLITARLLNLTLHED